jgi:hypothetical protein
MGILQVRDNGVVPIREGDVSAASARRPAAVAARCESEHQLCRHAADLAVTVTLLLERHFGIASCMVARMFGYDA